MGYRDKKIVVTGATGLFGRPLCMALAESNDVTGVARFTAREDAEALRRAGVRTVAYDLMSDDLSELPESADIVYHLGATTMVAGAGTSAQRELLQVNVQSTGRLMSRYRDAEAFVYASSGAVYAFQGDRALTEDDPLGLLNGLEDYSLSKIAAEQLVQFLSVEWSLPAVILRIVGLYSARGGLLTMRIDTVRSGGTVNVYPGVANRTSALHEVDFVALAARSPNAAAVPPATLNFTGTESVTVDDCCAWAAESLGTTANVQESDETVYPLLLDTSQMQELLGGATVTVRDGINRVAASNGAERLGSWSSWRTEAPGIDAGPTRA